jgi:protein SCO1/2
MALSPHKRMLAGFLLANFAIVAVAAYAVLLRPPAPPQIQGVLLDEGRPLPPFELIDQRGEPFDNEDLQGDWHLLSYGFTTCPDICPTTLNHLAEFSRRLREQGQPVPRVLFYSIDHRRDTPRQLAAYLPFFDLEITGLTHRDDPDNPHLPFEQGLGMVAKLEAAGAPDSSDYRVSHGVTLYLLNPRGELQAVFKPGITADNLPAFSTPTLVADYLAVRNYLASDQ